MVLVHGYMAKRSTLLPLGTYLRARCLKQQLYFSYRSGGGVEPAARALREHLRRNVGGGRIDLVCHSMGGLVARVYLQDLGGHRLKAITGVTASERQTGDQVVSLERETHDFSCLAKALLGANFRIHEMEEEEVNLETAFMRLTKGMVQ